MYAIIETGGKQYKVSKGDVISVEKLDANLDDKITFDKVLLIGGESTNVGNPYIEGASVEAKVISQYREKKVIVYKYKAKTGYHKKNGHRQYATKLEITKINK